MRGAVAAAVGVLALAFVSEAGGEPLPDWVRFEQRSGRSSVLPPTVLTLPPERRSAHLEGDHPYVEILRRYELALEPDDRLVERITVVRHYLSAEGVRESGTVTRMVRSLTTRVVVEEAWVRLPDGQVHDFDPSTLQIVENPEPDVFSDSHLLAFAFSNLTPGATVALILREETDLAKWPLYWSRLYFPQSLVPTERFEINVTWDAEDAAEAPHWATDDLELRCAVGRGALTCSRHQVPPVAYDPDVEWGDRLPHLAVGSAREWAQLVDRERRIVLDAAAPSEEIASVGRELELAGADPHERVELIHRFVADKVRYVAFHHGANAVVPHQASQTLARRYGDCKDKVTLFLALMRSAGLEAYPVLVATERYELAKLISPSWRYFDHMIACVPLGIAPPICVDLTDPYSDTGLLPLGLQGAVALELRDGVVRPSLLAAGGPAWQITVEAGIEVACDGGVVEVLRRRFGGAGAAVMRSTLLGMNSEERARWMADEYAETVDEGLDPDFEIEGLRGSEPSLTVQSRTEFEGQTALTSFSEWAEPDVWLLRYGGAFRTENLHHPYRMPGLQITTRNEYHLCPEMQAGFTGAVLRLRAEYGELSRHYARGENGSIAVVTQLDLPPRLVEAAELERFNRYIDRALGQSRIWFELRKAEPHGTGEAKP